MQNVFEKARQLAPCVVCRQQGYIADEPEHHFR